LEPGQVGFIEQRVRKIVGRANGILGRVFAERFGNGDLASALSLETRYEEIELASNASQLGDVLL
jgi:hypothetical protein